MGTLYYVRAYAINSYSKVYSNMVYFKTKDYNKPIDYWSFDNIINDYIDDNGEITYGINGNPLRLVNVSKGLSKSSTHKAINFSSI
jgi:hypothetical protein